MDSLTKDILREIFSYLDPVGYRNLRQVNKLCLEASNIPLTSYIYYENKDATKRHWWMKVDRLGRCLSFCLSDNYEELVDGTVKIYLEDGVSRTTITCKLDDQGFFQGDLRTKYYFVYGGQNIKYEFIYTIDKGVLSSGILDSINTNCFTLNIDGFSISYISGKVGMDYMSGKVSEIAEGTEPCFYTYVYGEKDLYQILLETKGKVKIRRYIPSGSTLSYLPFHLTQHVVPITEDNLVEIFRALPLHLANCWNQVKVSQQVDYMLRRLEFSVLSLLKYI